MNRLLFASVITVLGACTTVLPNYDELAIEYLENCESELRHENARWCFRYVGGKGWVLIEQRGGGVPIYSNPLPVRVNLEMNQVQRLAYAFDSIWVSYSDDPMEVLRIDPDTLEVQAQIVVGDSAYGVMAAGAGSVWVLSAGLLHRIDPLSNTIGASARVPGNLVAVGLGTVWVAAPYQVHQIDLSTLEVVESFPVPIGTLVSNETNHWLVSFLVEREVLPAWFSGILSVSEESVFVLLSDEQRGFFSCRRFCQPSKLGRVDFEQGAVVVDRTLAPLFP